MLIKIPFSLDRSRIFPLFSRLIPFNSIRNEVYFELGSKSSSAGNTWAKSFAVFWFGLQRKDCCLKVDHRVNFSLMEPLLQNMYQSLMGNKKNLIWWNKSQYVSSSNRENLSGSNQNTSTILKEMQLEFNNEDISIVKYICHLISDRTAILVSICKYFSVE